MPSSSDGGSAVEADVSWWFAERRGQLGHSAQSYAFDEPKSDAVDTWEALARLVNPRQRKAVQRYNRQAPTMAQFQRRYPHEAAVLEAVYTPHAYPNDLTPSRLALSMPGARHMVTVIALLPASRRLRAARAEKGRTGESVQRYFAFELANQNGRLVRAVREELQQILDRALYWYGVTRNRSEAAPIHGRHESFDLSDMAAE